MKLKFINNITSTKDPTRESNENATITGNEAIKIMALTREIPVTKN